MLGAALAVVLGWAAPAHCSLPAMFRYETPPGPVQVVAGSQHDSVQEYRLSWSSGFVSPYPENNLVRAWLFRPAAESPCPAVIVLHSWRAKDFRIEKELSRRLAQQGMAALLLVLPYHGERAPPGFASGSLMVTASPGRIVDSIRQAIMDVESAIDWLETQPQIMPDGIGIAGISLGAIVADLAVSLEPRLKAGVSIVGGGDLPYILWNSLLTLGIKSRMIDSGISLESLKRSLHSIDPLTHASPALSNHLLMINGADDPVVPRRAAEEFWRAAGRPLIVWLPTGHFGPFLTKGRLFQLTADYLNGQFRGKPIQLGQQAIRAITLKVVAIYDRREKLRLGIVGEVASLSDSDRFSADLGLTTKIPFAGVSWHALEGLDAGLLVSIRGGPVRPFLAARLTF
jgi:dienelactone hydrolase